MKRVFVSLLLLAVSPVLFAQLTGPLSVTGAQSNFAQYLRMSSVDGATNKDGSTTVEEFNNKANTKGKRFLVNTWAKGNNVTDANNQAVDVSKYFFNYDMLTGSLLVTEDKKHIMSVAPSGVKAFTLENNGRMYSFMHIPLIDSNRFFLRITGNDSLYTLYRDYKVRFIKSDYHNDGLIQTRNPDDEYADASVFYIKRPNEETFRQISFKPKEIKNLLVAEKETVSRYFSNHSNDEINEVFLTGLIKEINRK